MKNLKSAIFLSTACIQMNNGMIETGSEILNIQKPDITVWNLVHVLTSSCQQAWLNVSHFV